MGHYAQAKVYNDGSHYIAIPHTERVTKRKPKPLEEVITISQEDSINDSAAENVVESYVSLSEDDFINIEEVIEDGYLPFEEEIKCKNIRKITKKTLFDELYQKYFSCKPTEKRNKIIKDMLPYFQHIRDCETFVNINIERKKRNMICRRVRMVRKANLAGFNYFCTFTYDNNLHTEDSFRKKLKTCLRNFCHRKNWKYMGVWERAPKTNRLHFHGLFYIPEGTMPGNLTTVQDYSTIAHKMQTSTQSSFFNKKFGRSDFDKIDTREKLLGSAIAYLIKYIEKTGEKIVYSKGLYQYFISDILDDDIVTTIGQEDKKLLLFDDFICLDEGVVVGRVSPEVIEQMKKCN